MAIAFDAITEQNGVGSYSFNHTITGSNPVLLVFLRSLNGDVVTACSYNSVAGTLVAKKQQVTVDTARWMYCYVFNAPATGTHSVSVTVTGSITIGGEAMSYTGASQSGQVDAFTTKSESGVSSGSIAVTTIADNCWLVGNCFAENSDPTVGANTTLRGTTKVAYDSNSAQTPAGSHSLNWTFSAGETYVGIVASVAPYVAPTGPTNLKSYNTNVKANIKTMNTNPIANVKTFDTNA